MEIHPSNTYLIMSNIKYCSKTGDINNTDLTYISNKNTLSVIKITSNANNINEIKNYISIKSNQRTHQRTHKQIYFYSITAYHHYYTISNQSYSSQSHRFSSHSKYTLLREISIVKQKKYTLLREISIFTQFVIFYTFSIYNFLYVLNL